jgi:hypothetical protein
LEGNIHSFDAYSARHWRKFGARPEQTVSAGAPLWEGDNMPLHRKPTAMHKLAARDFEDLLQVWTPWHLENRAYHIYTVRSTSIRGLTLHTEGRHNT